MGAGGVSHPGQLALLLMQTAIPRFPLLVWDNLCGEPFQAWEMWLSPHLENQWGAKLGGRTHVHG